jgi:Pseudouridylate synthases, 23S RNA-specific
MVIEHDAVRREPPVYNIKIPVIAEDPDFIVVNKPPSIPVKS